MAPTAERKKARRKQRQQKVLNKVAAWRQKMGEKYGQVWSIVPANLPEHDSSTVNQQANWVDEMLEKVDIVTVAECSGRLAEAIDRGYGTTTARARPNYGGNGNVVATGLRMRGRRRFPRTYGCSYRANSGRRFELNMARATLRKGLTRCTIDAIHAPSTGRFATSSSREQRAWVVEQIAARKAKTKARVISGDFNDNPEWVLAVLRKVDKGWKYLGGHGVEHVFGLNVVAFPDEDTTINYQQVTDHTHTAIVKFGVLV